MASPSDSPASGPTHAGPQKPKVIYVMGQGKSGSTILGVSLSNCTDVFFAGELCNWLATSGKPILGGSERVSFWQAVSEEVEGGPALFGPESYQCFERGLSAFRVDRWGARRRLRGRYRRVTENLYRAIAARAGATHIVDTSHLPMRAHELQGMGGIDLYLIFLVRNVEGIVASHTRSVKRHQVAELRMRFLSTTARLWVTYLLALFVFLRQPPDRRLLVHHEDFVANPEGVLREVLDFAGSPAEIPDLTSLSTGIPLTGNPLLRQEVVAVKPKAAPPARPSRLMRLSQRPWTMILSRLQPAATGTSVPARASDPGRS